MDSTRISYDRFLEYDRLSRLYPAVHGFNPTPLGFSAFALTLFVYCMIMCGATVYQGTSPALAMGLALFYGGLILLLAGLGEYRLGNNFYGLAFCSYAGYWLGLASLYVAGSFAFTTTVGSTAVYTDTTTLAKAFGIFYLGWTIFTLLMLIASIRTNVVTVLFFFFLFVTYVLFTTSYFLMGDPNTARAAGAFGIFTAVIGWFAAFASLLKKDENSYFNIPVFDISRRSGMGGPASVEVPK
jgi:succinate-acetate transporter protein